MSTSLRSLCVTGMFLMLAPVVFATALGTLDVANCAGGGVAITSTGIDFLPAGGGTGCIQTGAATSVTYTGGGPLLSGVTGAIKDIAVGGGIVTDFMVFLGNPNLHFDLSLLGPGSPNTLCSGLALGASCSPIAGSPFVLTNLGSSTLLAFSAAGLARDASAITSKWTGAFTTTLPNITAAQLQAMLLSGGIIVTTDAGNFDITATAVPEPSSMLLLGTGLIGVGTLVRKLRTGSDKR